MERKETEYDCDDCISKHPCNEKSHKYEPNYLKSTALMRKRKEILHQTKSIDFHKTGFLKKKQPEEKPVQVVEDEVNQEKPEEDEVELVASPVFDFGSPQESILDQYIRLEKKIQKQCESINALMQTQSDLQQFTEKIQSDIQQRQQESEQLSENLEQERLAELRKPIPVRAMTQQEKLMIEILNMNEETDDSILNASAIGTIKKLLCQS